MLNHSKFLWGLLCIVVLSGISYAALSFTHIRNQNSSATSTASTSTVVEASSTSFTASNVTMELYKETKVGGTVLKPWAVLEDSRCASDVQCVWSGRVRVALSIQSSNESVAGAELQPEQSIKTKNLKITLLEVKPYPISTHKTTDNEYRFYFKIEPLNSSTATSSASTPKPITKKSCYAGGCSGQLCTDNPNAVSTCEYSAAYACYRYSVCEQQADGKCGWTETPALKTCLSNNGAQTY